ncbi:MAG TPA: hypothetical protein VMU84_22035, partial [Thermoanaerobaculia bacterium]|nr:hypothetical protein [Thermoanaerobaculia bacterium]
SALGASTITIENLQSTVTPLDQGELIAGIPTKHYRVNLNYDITVVFRGVPLKQSVRTVVDKWMTLQFGDIAESMLASGQFRTGNAKIDELIDIETRKIKGLPLRQTATITTTNLRGASMNPELKLPTTRVLTREMRVTAIREAKPEANAFTVPSGFQRAEGAAPPKPEMQVITFTPPTK